MDFIEITNNLKQKYYDAVLLKDNHRYANSIYLSGYCVELSLKYAIAKHMGWPRFYTEGKFNFLKVHDLDFLASLTGRDQIKSMPAWSIVNKWKETDRYVDPATSSLADAEKMLKAVKILVEDLCKISL